MTDITELAQLRAELSNPANGSKDHLRKLALLLVEALEKAQRANAAQDDHINQQQDRIDILERRNAELGGELSRYSMSPGQADQRVCESRAARDALGFGKDADDVAPINLRERIDGMKARIAELESRTVKLPPELYTIGELIRTQDNRITDQPMFVVFQKREIIGSDEHSPSRICWVWDGEEVSELRAKRLEALYQDGRDTRGYDRYAMQEVDEFVTACFTEHGCKDYLRQNGHNLRLPYIYACGSFRNNEYQLVRNWLAGIKVEAE
ncbi:hypothetical protein ACYA1P_13005 [Klebsiella pneumoniae]